MEKVLAKYPTLTMEGINRPQGKSLLLPDALAQFELAVCWLRCCPKTKKPTRGSYGLKHVVQDWMGAYCCNGVMIAAAIHLEFVTDIDSVVVQGATIEALGLRTGNPNIRIGIGGRETHWLIRPGSRTHNHYTQMGKKNLPNLMYPDPELVGRIKAWVKPIG